MQGSVTGVVGRDLHRQVLALLTQGPGSYSGKFGEALEKISAIGDSLKNGQTVNWTNTKAILDAAKTALLPLLDETRVYCGLLATKTPNVIEV